MSQKFRYALLGYPDLAPVPENFGCLTRVSKEPDCYTLSLQPVDIKKPVQITFSTPRVCHEDSCSKDCEALGWRVRVLREDKPLRSSLCSERNAGVPGFHCTKTC